MLECQFRTGHFSVASEQPSGGPISVSVPANVKTIHDYHGGPLNNSQKYCYISGNRTRVCANMRDDLEASKVGARWIQKLEI